MKFVCRSGASIAAATARKLHPELAPIDFVRLLSDFYSSLASGCSGHGHSNGCRHALAIC